MTGLSSPSNTRVSHAGTEQICLRKKDGTSSSPWDVTHVTQGQKGTLNEKYTPAHVAVKTWLNR
jgi:hypothetical protein